jgi:hypothetical protein
MFETCLIQYFKESFFKSCDLVLAPWIKFFHFFISFTHTHLHYISQKLLNMGISWSFHLNMVHDKRILWEKCYLYQVHLRVLYPIIKYLIYVFLSLVDDMHKVGPTLDMILVFLHLEVEFTALGF